MSRERKVSLLSAFLCNFPYTFIVGPLTDRIAGGSFVQYNFLQWVTLFFLGLGISAVFPLLKWGKVTRRTLFRHAMGSRLAKVMDFFFYMLYYQLIFSLFSTPLFHFWTRLEERSVRGTLNNVLPFFLVGLVLNLIVCIIFNDPCDWLADKLIPREDPEEN